MAYQTTTLVYLLLVVSCYVVTAKVLPAAATSKDLTAVESLTAAVKAPLPAADQIAVEHPMAKQAQETVIIDGKINTIGLTAADYFSGTISGSFEWVINIIINVMAPTPEEDIDYFGLIKEDVEQVVGEYINQHNMDQIEVYKEDLASLMLRYSEAPVSSSTYPDKNTVANSLSTSIVANRFLIEAVEWPHSMMLHYADIASIHLMVLKDAAETYTKEGETPSYWWVDLDNELDHYINFGRNLENTVVDWRNDMMDCTYAECTKQSIERVCYDVWTVVDQVAALTDACRALHGDSSCDDHCQAYQVRMNRDVSLFVFYYLGRVLAEWEELKVLSASMAEQVVQHGQ